MNFNWIGYVFTLTAALTYIADVASHMGELFNIVPTNCQKQRTILLSVVLCQPMADVLTLPITCSRFELRGHIEYFISVDIIIFHLNFLNIENF